MDIKAYVAENYEAMMSLFEELCKIPAPSGKEEKRAEFCKNWLESIGAKGVYVDDALNVIFPINCDGKDKITVFAAHTDTVFPDLEPMPYLDDGEKIHCPGCGDDTASLSVLLFIAKYIIENNIEPKNGVLIVCNSCEEGLGNLKGTRQLFADFEGRISKFISLDSNIDKIADRCVGSSRYRVTVKTKGGHSYLDFPNVNAINALSKIVTEIYGIEIPTDGVSKTTVNVGKISGGTSVNTIAQEAEMLCEYRSDNAEHIDIMKEKFLKIFENAQSDEVEIEVENVGERPSARGVDPAEIDKMKKICGEIIKDIAGIYPEFRSCSTDCNIPLSLGVPALCIGVCDGDGQHTREEWVNKESLRKGLEIGIKVMSNLMNG